MQSILLTGTAGFIGSNNYGPKLQIVDKIYTMLENELLWRADETSDTGIIKTVEWYLNKYLE